MKINVGGEYSLDSDKLISFFDKSKDGHLDDRLIYLGRFFIYTLNSFKKEETYDNAYIFYSKKEKNFLYSVKREDFALEEEFDSDINFVNFKDNQLFINDNSFKYYKEKFHSVWDDKENFNSAWIDEDDYLNNKKETDLIFKS